MNANKPQTGRLDESDPPDTDYLPDDALHAVEKFAEEAKNIARQAQATLSAPADNLAQHARSLTGEGGRDMAHEVAALAGEIGKASEALDESDQAALESYARTITSGLENALEQGGTGDLTDRLRQFARTQPAAFLGTAVLAGLAAGRRARMYSHRPNRGDQTSAGGSTRAAASPSPPGDGAGTQQFEQGLGSSSDAAAARSGGDRMQTRSGH